MKWGNSAPGEPVTITYALADRPLEPGGQINCRRIADIDAVLAPAGITTMAFRAELQAAFAMWEAVARVQFQPAKRSEDADFVLAAQAEPRGIAFTDLHHREAAVPGFAEITRAIVCLNPEQPWHLHADGQNATYELTRVLAHEIGHVLGLDHPGPDGPLMGYRYREELKTLQPGDKAGVQALYGAAESSNRHVEHTAHGQKPLTDPALLDTKSGHMRWGLGAQTPPP